MIEEYINEFFLSPNDISNEKITFIKNYFYPEINQFKKIKRENFQVGIQKNRNVLFFRDKTNKHEEIILHLVTNKKFNNFRKDISFTTYNNNSFEVINVNKNIIDNNSKDPLITNNDSIKINNKCNCIVS
tara:strand:- start:747 stop:1136 length:390 start_codon:yes stop_codon:yes gene_type:complete